MLVSAVFELTKAGGIVIAEDDSPPGITPLLAVKDMSLSYPI